MLCDVGRRSELYAGSRDPQFRSASVNPFHQGFKSDENRPRPFPVAAKLTSSCFVAVARMLLRPPCRRAEWPVWLMFH